MQKHSTSWQNIGKLLVNAALKRLLILLVFIFIVALCFSAKLSPQWVLLFVLVDINAFTAGIALASFRKTKSSSFLKS